ncbi:homeodomain transcription factor [Desarmillaria tabescens]|uniref:Homeodomain transcription factor n=1 Tax=Armillaria tabescens TaxID=1929756 RepID=A0AA39TNX7_ARMTA|nr:homeodomain transcription factor [Desarmillaria tabescens]KAK0465522.1 homeodomain transcription factor [Desarmillaria tabescens]
MPPSTADRPKKPRNRHSPEQLAALNELYERDEHPALEVRTSLAEQLGMETKTVNSWFQNKRASTKKRTVAQRSLPYDSPRINPQLPSNSSSASTTPRPSELGDYQDDDYLLEPPHFNSENDSMPRRLRLRPTPDQADELKRVYSVNPHPTTEQRQILAERTGMRYQSVTNWFQNQRSLAKKRKEDDLEAPMQAEYPSETRSYSAFPPANRHPSLALPPANNHPSLALSRGRRSPSAQSSTQDDSPPSLRRSSSRRSATPYSMSSRLRRARPEPHQLEALKGLFDKNPTPTIEERSVLAHEIGMDLGKVTNWFRNLRQTSRRRAKKSGSGDDDDDYGFPYSSQLHSASASRYGSPSSSSDDAMDYDEEPHPTVAHSDDIGSDEEIQEAVTPSPSPSPPPRTMPSPSRQPFAVPLDALINYVELERATMKFTSGIKAEDAFLLLSFQQQYVH